MADEEDKQRIAELEAEVASLRAKLSEDSGDAAISEHERSDDGAGLAPRPSKVKVAIFSAIVVVVALALMLAVFTALSKGFDRFADKAAKHLAPKGPAPALHSPRADGASAPVDAGPPKEQVLVPGL